MDDDGDDAAGRTRMLMKKNTHYCIICVMRQYAGADHMLILDTYM